ncbi:MAG TPA: site-2 protease family protein [Polyangia bacterium]|nr:site-2 protease family protein [Polyangia bacterium]
MDITPDHVRAALFYVIAFVISVAVHEFGHAFVADRLGDRIPRLQGRLTLSPMAHIDPIGTLAVPLLGVLAGLPLFAWGKPVQTNPANYTRRFSMRTGSMLVAAAGPFMNLVLALVGSIAIVVLTKAGVLSPKLQLALFGYIVLLNIALMFFNLLPLGPLDGAAVLAGLLPPSLERINELNRKYGMLVLLLLFLSPSMGLPGLSFVMRPVGALVSFWMRVMGLGVA